MDSERMRQPFIEPGLLSGDIAASEARWTEAIDSWDRAAQSSPELQDSASARISWFLAHQSGTRGAGSGNRIGHLIVLSLSAAVMATALALLTEDPGSGSSNMVAIGAWSLIVISAVMAIVATRRIGTAHTTNVPARAIEVVEARRLAGALDTQHMKSDAIDE